MPPPPSPRTNIPARSAGSDGANKADEPTPEEEKEEEEEELGLFFVQYQASVTIEWTSIIIPMWQIRLRLKNPSQSINEMLIPNS